MSKKRERREERGSEPVSGVCLLNGTLAERRRSDRDAALEHWMAQAEWQT